MNIAENIRDKAEPVAEGGTGVVEFPSLEELWYFAHPYTSKDKRAEEANFNLCCIRSAKLIQKGYFVYSPIAHTHPIHLSWPEFLEKDERELWIGLDMVIIKRTNFYI